MIRNDLKEKLDGKNLDEVFLKHRPGIDQPGYRVGKVGEEVVVLNESSGKIMDYFYDDVPDKEWFSLSLYKPEHENYEINKNTGRIRNVKTGKILSLNCHEEYYVSASLHVSFSIHVYLGRIFIPNLDPDVNYMVDHIDRDKSNNSLNNLRWVDAKVSRRNQRRDRDEYRYQYFAYSDKEMNNLVYTFDCVSDIIRILNTDGGSTENETVRGAINSSIAIGSNYYRGYYWKKENVVLKQYLAHIGYSLSDINLNDFIYNPIYKVKVNIKLGIIITNRRNEITCGTLLGGNRYKTMLKTSLRDKKHNLYMSHIIWSTANGCQPIPNGKEIDHINSDPLDNRAENLRLVDNHSENMKNPNTQAKIKAAKEAKKTQKN